MPNMRTDQETIAAAIATNAPYVGRLRSRTLVGSRWLALVGQMSAVLLVHFVLGYQLPLLPCVLAIGCNAALNLFITVAMPAQRLVRQWEAAAQLLFDVLQLAFLLFLTGGIENPFCLLFIAPATIAAATLQPRWTLTIIIVTLICIGGLSIWSYPLPWDPPGTFELPVLYRFGIAYGIGVGLLFTAGYAWRVSVEEARLADALIATQEILAREQRLAALGGLAAAAAHELGTPLATIQVTAKELARALPEGSPDHEDATLILSQAQRCREILRNLTAHNEHSDPTVVSLPLGQLLEEAADRHVDRKGDKVVLFDIERPSDESELIVSRMPAVLYGIGNLIENATQFAKSAVTVSAAWDVKTVRVTISDDGSGFDEDVLVRLGEPYITTRGVGTLGSRNREGMGLGFFIAKTLLERSGGRVTFWNQAAPSTGAVVRIEWARSDIEIKRGD
jgi:two-component system, sensor histidine kinase RegB